MDNNDYVRDIPQEEYDWIENSKELEEMDMRPDPRYVQKIEEMDMRPKEVASDYHIDLNFSPEVLKEAEDITREIKKEDMLRKNDLELKKIYTLNDEMNMKPSYDYIKDDDYIMDMRPVVNTDDTGIEYDDRQNTEDYGRSR